MDIETVSNHFIVLCARFPEFSFNLPELRRYRRERDQNPHAVGTVVFHQRLLDTKECGYDEEEARIIKAALMARISIPLWGIDIVEPGQVLLGSVPDGTFTCGNCPKRFASMDGLTKHYEEKHRKAA